MARFDLTQKQRDGLIRVQDDIITKLGKLCKLFYQPKLVDCSNCNLPAIDDYAGNIWTHGGPLRVDQAGCNFCGGTGKIAQEYTENITLTIDWAPKAFKNANNVAIPFAFIGTRGYITDLPKIQKCIKLQVALPLQGYIIAEYALQGEAFDANNVIQGRYFIAYWNRI